MSTLYYSYEVKPGLYRKEIHLKLGEFEKAYSLKFWTLVTDKPKNLSSVKAFTDWLESQERRVGLILAAEILARSSSSKKQLQQKLKTHGLSLSSIEHCLDKLAAYVDEESLAENLKQKAIREGRGSLWLERKCFEKGIATPKFSQEELGQAFLKAREKVGVSKNLDFKEKQKALRKLQARGFDYQCFNSFL